VSKIFIFYVFKTQQRLYSTAGLLSAPLEEHHLTTEVALVHLNQVHFNL